MNQRRRVADGALSRRSSGRSCHSRAGATSFTCREWRRRFCGPCRCGRLIDRAHCSPSSPAVPRAGNLRRFNSPQAPAYPPRLSAQTYGGTIQRRPSAGTILAAFLTIW
jgi:hypothetical protein